MKYFLIILLFLLVGIVIGGLFVAVRNTSKDLKEQEEKHKDALDTQREVYEAQKKAHEEVDKATEGSKSDEEQLKEQSELLKKYRRNGGIYADNQD